MNDLKDYRPDFIEFNYREHNTIMPDSFGEFESLEHASKFVGGNVVAVNMKMETSRKMDAFEKSEMRKRYNNILENMIPEENTAVAEAEAKLKEAKENLKRCQENLNASHNQVESLAKQVKRGLIDIDLDNISTFRIPYNGKFYFYTFIDGELRLCHHRDIGETEARDLYTAMNDNSKFLEEVFDKPYDEMIELLSKLRGRALNNTIESKDESGGMDDQLNDFQKEMNSTDGETTTQEG